MSTLDLARARNLRVGDRILLDGRGRTPWLVTKSYRREAEGGWWLTCKRGRDTTGINTFPDSWFDKVVER
jgi:hypothetical protein